MTQINVHCPLCSQPGEIYKEFSNLGIFQGRCDRCGEIHITEEAVTEAARLNKRHVLSSWFRRHQRGSGTMVPYIKKAEAEAIIADAPEYSVLEKLDRTLTEIELTTTQPGQRSRFTAAKDYPLVYAASPDEAAFYINQLAEVGYVRFDGGALITAKGFQRLEDLKRTGRSSSFAFVAMWFNPSMNAIYDDAIAPAIRGAGYRPIRVDRVEHVNRIDDEIIGRIKASRFLVADFSGQRQGVYFEAGMMLGLGRTVIWMCKEEELKETHFDTRQYNFINYKTVDEARKRLYDRIMAIEGAGPEMPGETESRRGLLS